MRLMQYILSFVIIGNVAVVYSVLLLADCVILYFKRITSFIMISSQPCIIYLAIYEAINIYLHVLWHNV